MKNPIDPDDFAAYLQASDIIDWQHPEILQLAHHLAATPQTTEDIAKACFEWVLWRNSSQSRLPDESGYLSRIGCT